MPTQSALDSLVPTKVRVLENFAGAAGTTLKPADLTAG